MKIIISFLVLLLCCSVCQSQVLYENSFDDKPDWTSSQLYTGLATSNAEALTIGFSEINVGSDILNGPNLFQIGAAYKRGTSGKGLAWRIESYGLTSPNHDAWAGGRLIMHFADPNLFDETVNDLGYAELWVRFWVNYGNSFEWGNGPIFKIFRAYAHDGGTNWQNVWDSSTHGGLGDHYNPDGSYKTPHIIPDWSQGVQSDPYYLPTQCAQCIECNYVLPYHCTTLGYRETKLFSTVMPDKGNWHLHEFHLRLNDIGQANTVVDLYIDGTLFAGAPNIPATRQSSTALIDHLVMFDNHQVDSNAPDDVEQTIMIDDLVISTTRLATDYKIGGTSRKPTPWIFVSP